MAEEVVITFETLFELLRREKSREELQPLEPGFLADVSEYIKKKIEAIDSLKKRIKNKTGNERLLKTELKRLELQKKNIEKILQELYERREKKILTMAMHASRVEESIVDKSAMLKHEIKMFEQILCLLNKFRQDILLKLLEAGFERQKRQKAERIKIKFLESVPRFVGTDLKEYGPFKEADTAELPYDIAQLLIKRCIAEKFD